MNKKVKKSNIYKSQTAKEEIVGQNYIITLQQTQKVLSVSDQSQMPKEKPRQFQLTFFVYIDEDKSRNFKGRSNIIGENKTFRSLKELTQFLKAQNPPNFAWLPDKNQFIIQYRIQGNNFISERTQTIALTEAQFDKNYLMNNSNKILKKQVQMLHKNDKSTENFNPIKNLNANIQQTPKQKVVTTNQSREQKVSCEKNKQTQNKKVTQTIVTTTEVQKNDKSIKIQQFSEQIKQKNVFPRKNKLQKLKKSKKVKKDGGDQQYSSENQEKERKTKKIKKQKTSSTQPLLQDFRKMKKIKKEQRHQKSQDNDIQKYMIGYENGQKYRGEVKNGKQHGDGTLYSENYEFKCIWKEGFPNGYGKWYENGEVYSGIFNSNFLRQGCGQDVYANKQSYYGNFKNSLRHGQGTYKFLNGDYYQGQWVQGKQQGKGRQVYADGSIFQGYWKDDQKNGEGIMTEKDLKTKWKQIWRNDELVTQQLIK